MNHVIYEDADKCIWYCSKDGNLHIDNRVVLFSDFIRAIDTIPEKSQEWKKDIITIWAEHYGFMGVA